MRTINLQQLKKTLVLLLLLFPFTNFAQCEDTGSDFVPPPELLNPDNFSSTVKSSFIADEPIVLSMYFYILGYTYDEEVSGVDIQNVLDNVAHLNHAFNQFNIFYKFQGYEYYSERIDGVEIPDVGFTTMFNRIDEIANHQRINVIVNEPTGMCNGAPGSSNFNKQMISINAISFKNFSNSHLIHHAARLAGALYTHQGTVYTTETIPNPYCGGASEPLRIPDFNIPDTTSEHVTRDVANPYYNADTHGDLVTDTHAAFKKSAFNHCYDDLTYLSHELIVDNSPDNEMYIDIEVKNYLTDNFTEVRSEFTNGQGVRMRETLTNPVFADIIDMVKTTVPNLYNPWKEVENADNTQTYYYQPGFSYDFIYCAGFAMDAYPVPSDYDDTSFYTISGIHNYVNYDVLNWTTVKQKNKRAVRIYQIEEQPRKCYHEWVPALSGMVTHYIDGVYNYNHTITPLDSLQINDPQLIQDLESGLYNIKKNYDDNIQDEENILKQD